MGLPSGFLELTEASSAKHYCRDARYSLNVQGHKTVVRLLAFKHYNIL